MQHFIGTKYDGRSILIGRLLPVIRTFISLPAGFARMAPVRFGLYTVAGCIPWIAGLAVASYAAGANWRRVTGLVQGAGYIVGALAILLMVAIVIVVVRCRRRRQSAPSNAAPHAGIDDHTDADRAARAAASDGPGYRKAG